MDWSERYTTPLTAVWSRAHKLSLEHRVESALVTALASIGRCPAAAADDVAGAVARGAATLERTLAIEAETHHDIMAMVKALSEQCPVGGGFVHYGATSQVRGGVAERLASAFFTGDLSRAVTQRLICTLPTGCQ